jgi:hypothetical protein
MKNVLVLLALILFSGSSLSFFRYQRPVETSGTGQRYFVVGETLWAHARPDLADLRLYSGQLEVPYVLVTEYGSLEQDHQAVGVLQQSSVGGKTQFFIDMLGIAEYDHVSLRLAAKDFVAHAHVEGQDDLHGRRWAALGDGIIYDLHSDNLGSNTTLRLPRTTYRYLRVTLDGPIRPRDVTGAASEVRQQQEPSWCDINGAPKEQQQGKDTVLIFAVPAGVPVERVVFEIDSAQPNFRREVEIQDDSGRVLGSGEINRIHMVRAGRKIDSEQQTANLYAAGAKTIKVTVHNGDDLPLKLTGARLEQHERRIYFEDAGQGGLTLYYGDGKLESPVYDYATLFLQQRNAGAAQLGVESTNAAYTGRPDERPWSERHPAVLWIAIVAAVLVLGALALRSMKTAAAQ